MADEAENKKDIKAVMEAKQRSLEAAALQAKNEATLMRENMRQNENVAAFLAGRASGYAEAIKEMMAQPNKKEGS